MEKFLSTKDIAKLFKVNIITVRRWINRGWIPATKIGKMFWVKNEDLSKLTKAPK